MNGQQAMAHFYHYSPESNQDHRQQAYYAPHPAMQHHQQHQHQHQRQQMGMFPIVPTLPSTPIYSRPSSSGSQPPMHKSFTGVLGMPATLTPMASPQPITHKPAMMMLQTDLCEANRSYYPSTPPLSSSGSVISSPGSCDMLQTPMNPMFSGLDGVERKPVIELDGQLENFPHLDWSNCASPPMTPGTLHHHFSFFFMVSCLALDR